MAEQSALVVFARLPVVGKVKTRLAKGVGAEAATAFYKACAEHTFRQVDALRDETGAVVAYSAAEEGSLVADWISSVGLDLAAVPQADSQDLGVRMHEATLTAFRLGARKVVVTGTDIPDLSTDIVRRALARLDKHQVVLGPAFDGGYYLIGLSASSKELFEVMALLNALYRDQDC